MMMFRALKVPLLPEALIDAVEDCDLDYEKFTFPCFWKVLQLLRNREGFSSAEMKEVCDTFRLFDRNHKGELSTRRVPHALRWLGFMLSHRAGSVDWRDNFCHRVHICEAEFLKIVRDHTEAD